MLFNFILTFRAAKPQNPIFYYLIRFLDFYSSYMPTAARAIRYIYNDVQGALA
jgi:hypothetical protein